MVFNPKTYKHFLLNKNFLRNYTISKKSYETVVLRFEFVSYKIKLHKEHLKVITNNAEQK